MKISSKTLEDNIVNNVKQLSNYKTNNYKTSKHKEQTSQNIKIPAPDRGKYVDIRI